MSRGIDVLFGTGTAVGLSERRLIERFVTTHDASAFEAIVARHGPLVWSVCRRALRDPNDAEDAFQATFLILARRAGAIRRRDQLAGWLHGVAHRVSVRARRDAARRSTLVAEVPLSTASVDRLEILERADLLHDEIDRLPARYRDPVILCHVEGCTHDEAAARLGWPVGTVRGRLSRGRDRLRDRLARRGLDALAAPVALMHLPQSLTETTVKAATTFAAGQAASGLVSSQSSQWAQGVLHTMFTTKLKLAALSFFAAGLIVSAAGALAIAQKTEAPEKAADRPEAKEAEPGKGTIEPADKPVQANADQSAVDETESPLQLEEKENLAARIDLLEVKVEMEKLQYGRALKALAEFRTEADHATALRENKIDKERRQEREERALMILQVEAERLKGSYLDDRLELFRQQRKLRKLDGLANVKPVPRASNSLTIEQRLAAIEAALQEIRDLLQAGGK